MSTPMWNFSIPYKLKQSFDVIIKPELTFKFDPLQGYSPLLKDRPTAVIVASGSDFVTGMNRGRIDMATPTCAKRYGSLASTMCISSLSGRRPGR